MTKRERTKLAEAVRIFMCDDPDLWDDGMVILCRLLNPGWRPPEPPKPATIRELVGGADEHRDD